MVNKFQHAPSHFKLVEDVIFDITGLNMSLIEIGALMVGVAIAYVVFQSPMFDRHGA